MWLEFKKIGKEWFVDLPTWEGSAAELEMIMGADTMLDCISSLKNNERNIKLYISTIPKTFKSEFLEKDYKYFSSFILEQDNGGGTYMIDDYGTELLKINNPIFWLCNVTKYVFEGEFPPKLFIAFEIN